MSNIDHIQAKHGANGLLAWLLPWRARKAIRALKAMHPAYQAEYNRRTVRPKGWIWCNWCHLWCSYTEESRGDVCLSCSALLAQARQEGGSDAVQALKQAPPNVFRPQRLRNHPIQINGRWLSPLLSPERSNRQGNAPDAAHQRPTGKAAAELSVWK